MVLRQGLKNMKDVIGLLTELEWAEHLEFVDDLQRQNARICPQCSFLNLRIRQLDSQIQKAQRKKRKGTVAHLTNLKSRKSFVAARKKHLVRYRYAINNVQLFGRLMSTVSTCYAVSDVPPNSSRTLAVTGFDRRE